jgi:hypothetical protein
MSLFRGPLLLPFRLAKKSIKALQEKVDKTIEAFKRVLANKVRPLARHTE